MSRWAVMYSISPRRKWDKLSFVVVLRGSTCCIVCRVNFCAAHSWWTQLRVVNVSSNRSSTNTNFSARTWQSKQQRFPMNLTLITHLTTMTWYNYRFLNIFIDLFLFRTSWLLHFCLNSQIIYVYISSSDLAQLSRQWHCTFSKMLF